MLNLPFRVGHAVLAAAILVIGGGTASAHDRIGISLRPSAPSVAVGDVVDVEVFIVKQPVGGSTSQLGNAMSGMDLYFAWNPLDLRLIGINGDANAEQLFGSYFPLPAQDFTGTNEAAPPADGTGFYIATALAANPVYATLSGTRVTAFRFQVLREFETTQVNPLVSVTMPGSTTQRFTRVLDAAAGGYSSTGTLSGATISQGSESACPADLDGDGLVEGPDLARVLAAWGTVNSPANFIRTSLSPDVDGSDLAVLLAAWGPCPN